MQITAAQRLVIASLRLARAKAITKSVHYRVDFISANQLQVAQMASDGAGGWAIDNTKKNAISLPPNTHFASGTQCSSSSAIINTNIEFNSRGIPTNLAGASLTLAAAVQIALIDDFGTCKALQAWPSGQINEL